MGNSEVGHNALGSGQVFAQGAKLVSQSIEKGIIFESDTWRELVGGVKANNTTLHFLGLFSDGNVHSHIDHLKALIENAKKDGVVTLPSGLQYQVITEGNGKKPSATDRVQCHYEGTLIDGTIFDSSIKRGEPAVFGVNQVIRGWVEALQLMQEGAKWRLYIPYDMAYGEHGAGEMIPPYSALIFDVELIKVL
jgi:hypothetical protein